MSFFAANAQTPDQIAAESKRANDFFDKCWDETLARHPVDESFYGIKTHYDQLEDLSEEKAGQTTRFGKNSLRRSSASSNRNCSIHKRH